MTRTFLIFASVAWSGQGTYRSARQLMAGDRRPVSRSTRHWPAPSRWLIPPSAPMPERKSRRRQASGCATLPAARRLDVDHVGVAQSWRDFVGPRAGRLFATPTVELNGASQSRSLPPDQRPRRPVRF